MDKIIHSPYQRQTHWFLPTPFAGLGEIQVTPCQLLDKHFILSLHFQKLSPYFSIIIIQEFGITFFVLKRQHQSKLFFFILGNMDLLEIFDSYFHLRSIVFFSAWLFCLFLCLFYCLIYDTLYARCFSMFHHLTLTRI